jgi:hypothetical protein
MRQNYVQVDEHPGLVRDRKSGAILNINKNSITQARVAKKKRKADADRLDVLENKLERALDLLEALVNKDG